MASNEMTVSLLNESSVYPHPLNENVLPCFFDLNSTILQSLLDDGWGGGTSLNHSRLFSTTRAGYHPTILPPHSASYPLPLSSSIKIAPVFKLGKSFNNSYLFG